MRNTFGKAMEENRRTLALAAPIMAGQAGQMLMGWADSVMLGHVSTDALAASAFANTVLAVPTVFGFGLLSCVSVRASHAFGGADRGGAAAALQHGTLLGALLGVITAVAIHAGLPLVHVFGQPVAVAEAAKPYLALTGWSLVPVFAVAAGKNWTEALSRPWAPFWILMGGVLLNVVLNWIFIFGSLGLPAMGVTGAALATLLARIATAACLFWYIGTARSFAGWRPQAIFGQLRLWRLRELLTIGLPAGGQLLCEVSAFAIASIMMGWIGTTALAAHQIAITCAATTFMLPLGLAMATSVRVGQAIGAGEEDRLRAISFGAIGLGVAIMLCSTVVFLTGGRTIASWFIGDPAVIAMGAQLLVIAGIFQVVDGAQVVALNALRGMADVRVPMVIALVAYWAIALPVSYLLAFEAGMGPSGIWAGLAVGLAVAAAALIVRVRRRTTYHWQLSIELVNRRGSPSMPEHDEQRMRCPARAALRAR